MLKQTYQRESQELDLKMWQIAAIGILGPVAIGAIYLMLMMSGEDGERLSGAFMVLVVAALLLFVTFWVPRYRRRKIAEAAEDVDFEVVTLDSLGEDMSSPNSIFIGIKDTTNPDEVLMPARLKIEAQGNGLEDILLLQGFYAVPHDRYNGVPANHHRVEVDHRRRAIAEYQWRTLQSSLVLSTKIEKFSEESRAPQKLLPHDLDLPWELTPFEEDHKFQNDWGSIVIGEKKYIIARPGRFNSQKIEFQEDKLNRFLNWLEEEISKRTLE